MTMKPALSTNPRSPAAGVAARRPRVQRPMHRGLAALLAIAAISAAACGSDEAAPPTTVPGDLPPDDPQGPTFLTFASDDTAYTVAEMITISAIVTDPDGIDDVVGGSLLIIGDDAVERTLGTFATSAQEGAYALTVSASTLLEATRRTDEAMDHRPTADIVVRATFYDQAGHQARRELTIAVACVIDGDVADYGYFGYIIDGACVQEPAYYCACIGDACGPGGDGYYSCTADGSGEYTMNQVCDMLDLSCGSCQYGSCTSTNANYRKCECE